MLDQTAPALPTEEDYRRYDRIWHRVAPEYNPYPDIRETQDAAGMLSNAPGGACCMGDAAQTEVIQGFLCDELADAQIYHSLAAHAPTSEAKRVMRQLSSDAAEQAKTLQTAYFLITGEVCTVSVVLPPQPKLTWRDRLRERYHAAACAGFNYARAAEETTDPCQQEIFRDLSSGARRRAGQLRRLLSRTL